MASGLRRDFIRGVFWSGLADLSSQILGILSIAVLARLLIPETFGLLGMAIIYFNFILLFSDFGIPLALIRQPNLTNLHTQSGFWGNLVLGFALCLATQFLAPLLGIFFANALVSDILRVLSLGFLLGPFDSIQRALLRRKLAFRLISICDILAQLIYLVVSIVLAWCGWGVWALAIALLACQTAQVLLLWHNGPFRPHFQFDWQSMRELIGFGTNVLGTQIVHYFRQNIDYTFIGRVLGAGPLAFYSAGFQWSMYPLTRLVPVITRVSFPFFSGMEAQRDSLRYSFLKVSTVVVLVSFPLLIGLAVSAPEFISLVYGSNWVQAISPLRWLIMGGMAACVSSMCGSTLKAIGKANLELIIAISSFLLLAIMVLVGVQFGIVGVAIAVSVESSIISCALLIVTCSQLGIGLHQFLSANVIVLVASLVMGVVAIVVRIWLFQWFPGTVGELLSLVGANSIGLAVYLGVVRFGQPELWSEFLQALSALLPSRVRGKFVGAELEKYA